MQHGRSYFAGFVLLTVMTGACGLPFSLQDQNVESWGQIESGCKLTTQT